MKNRLGIVLLLSLALVTGANAAAPSPEVPALTRIASKLSGLRAAHRVSVRTVSPAAMLRQAKRLLDRDYPPEQQAYDETLYRALGLLAPGQSLRPTLLRLATTNVLGLYDPVQHVLYVRSGSARRAALLHGLVRALEDQTFDLRRMAGLRRSDRDAALAASAAVEGEASFASQLVGVATPPAPSATGSPLAGFLGLEQDFPATLGLHFVTTLHNLGGNKAVFSALKQFPLTSEQVFHIDAFLTREPALPVQLPPNAAGMSLQHSDTFGELDVRALLAVFHVPRLAQAGEGWGGGRTALYSDSGGQQAVAVALNWDTDLDAAQWAEAATTYVNEAFDPDTPGPAPTTPCGTGDACWSVGGHQVALAVNGSRTALVFASTTAAADVLARAAVGT